MKQLHRGAAAVALLLALQAQAQPNPSPPHPLARQMPTTTRGFIGQGNPEQRTALLSAPTWNAAPVRWLAPSDTVEMIDYVENRKKDGRDHWGDRDAWDLWWLVRTTGGERGWINAESLRVR